MIEVSGKPLVKGDIDPSLRFRRLEIDWVGEGYDLFVRCQDANRLVTDNALIAVDGSPQDADLVSVEPLCVEAGDITLQIVGKKSGVEKTFGEAFVLNVRKALPTP